MVKYLPVRDQFIMFSCIWEIDDKRIGRNRRRDIESFDKK